MFKLDMADVRPSVISFVTVGLMAAIFILTAKWLLNRYPVPFLSDAANAL